MNECAFCWIASGEIRSEIVRSGDHAHANAYVVPLHEKTEITSLRYITEEVARALPEELAAKAAQLRKKVLPLNVRTAASTALLACR
jgi:hypothetical protein